MQLAPSKTKALCAHLPSYPSELPCQLPRWPSSCCHEALDSSAIRLALPVAASRELSMGLVLGEDMDGGICGQRKKEVDIVIKNGQQGRLRKEALWLQHYGKKFQLLVSTLTVAQRPANQHQYFGK